MAQISQVVTVEGNMAGLQLGDDIDDNESESSVESLEDDILTDDASSHIIAAAQLPHEDNGEDEEFEFFGDSSLKNYVCFYS